jgi:DNA-directed RNA polymerase alpha subunit
MGRRTPQSALRSVSAERAEWAEHLCRRVQAHLEQGRHELAQSICRDAQLFDPDIRPQLSDLTVQERYELPTSALRLSLRTSNALEAAGYLTIGQLVETSAEDVCRVPGLGLTAVREIN